uniref:Saccharopine dehydrogenase NADP binding domain-containing protein n=2 Tax=Aegilops tauschii subsp. strangulata TaxID=200361 RepID=A0A453IKH0_AEGTS
VDAGEPERRGGRRHLRGLGLHRQVRHPRGAQVPPPNASPLRSLALADRSWDRVAAAPGPAPDVPILVADASDPASLAAVAARARVLLSCAGPFRLHGRQVAAACAEAGADCLDISGEPEFMERVEADLHEVAAKNGSLIVSACGFDSIPAELGFLFNSRQWTPPSAPLGLAGVNC